MCISVKLSKTNILEACWRKLWDDENGYFLCGLQLCESTEDYCNSFENVLKYQYITDTLVFLGNNVHSVFPSSHIDWVQHKML